MTVLDSEHTTLEACLAAMTAGPVVLKKKGQVTALVQSFVEERLKQSLHPVFVDFDDTSLQACLKASKKGYVAIKRNGEFVAILQPFDQEQFELSTSEKFWRMVAEWRKPGQKRYTLEEIDRLFGFDKPARQKSKKAAHPKGKKPRVK